MLRKYGWLVVLFLSGCAGAPDNVQPVKNFELQRYLGTWYEIARLDHSFERDLQQVTATYSLRDDGGIRVVNKGFNPKKHKWKEAIGKAYFVGNSDIGQLKVSFFGPFYGGYNIIELDEVNYQYALVCGPNLSYLWILARHPELNKSIVDSLVAKANSLGFATDQLIFVKHR
jgi:apolipoprotein D and lipocalin family protein